MVGPLPSSAGGRAGGVGGAGGPAHSTALCAGDQLVGGLVLRDEARLHAEVDGLGVVGDDRDRGLLGQDGVTAGEGHSDLLEVEQAPDLLVLGLVRAGGVAPGVAAALVERYGEVAADLGVQPLGQSLRRL